MSLLFEAPARRLPPLRPANIDANSFVATVEDATEAGAPLDTRLPLCVRAMVDELGASAAFVWDLSHDGRELLLRADRGASREIGRAYAHLPVVGTFPGTVVVSGRPAAADLWSTPAPDETNWARRRGLRTF